MIMDRKFKILKKDQQPATSKVLLHILIKNMKFKKVSKLLSLRAKRTTVTTVVHLAKIRKLNRQFANKLSQGLCRLLNLQAG
jgi:hypothetical protein